MKKNRIDSVVDYLLSEQDLEILPQGEEGAEVPPAPGINPDDQNVEGEFDIEPEIGQGQGQEGGPIDYSTIDMITNQLDGLHDKFQEVRDGFPPDDQRREQASELGSIVKAVIKDLEAMKQ